MELKSRNKSFQCHMHRSNRTFMELKLKEQEPFAFEVGVLIVPLWN